MKRIHYILLSLAVLFTVFACDNFMDVHKDFVKDGEIIYAPKVDSITFIAGKERLLLRCWLYNSPNVRSVDLYWNDRADSLIIPVSPNTGLDSFNMVIPNLLEKSYLFDVRTTDIFGHKSLWATEFGNSYGANYVATLTNRRINSVSLVEKDGILYGDVMFFSPATLQVKNEIRYTLSTDGTTQTIDFQSSVAGVTVPHAKPGTTFATRSLYIPEEEAIDTFATEWVTHPTPFPSMYLYDRSGWTVHSVSDETASDGGGMHTVIDGDHGNWWHSQWEGGNVPLPHWLIIDLGKPLNAAQFDLYRRPGNTDTKVVEIYLGDTPDADGGTWTKVAQTEFNADKMVVTPTDKTTKGRYLKLVFVSSNREPFCNLSEIYMYGD